MKISLEVSFPVLEPYSRFFGHGDQRFKSQFENVSSFTIIVVDISCIQDGKWIVSR